MLETSHAEIAAHGVRLVGRVGEDMRAGRWSGFQKTECGLHGKG